MTPYWMRHVTVVSLSVVLLPILINGTPSDDRPQGWASTEPAVVVEMTNTLTFTPDTVTIRVGQTVRWENTSLLMHTVTADPGEATMAGSVTLPANAEPFDSGNMDPEETFQHTFDTPGTYTYFCIPHEAAKMRGTIIVEQRDGRQLHSGS